MSFKSVSGALEESPAWKTLIIQRVDLMKLCNSTDNWGPLDHIIAIDATNPSNHAVALRESCNATFVEETKRQLADLNINCAETGKSNFSKFITHVEALKNDRNPDEERWERIISERALETKLRNEDAIDGAKNKAIKVIDKLPDQARDAAGDLYARAMTGVGAFFRTIGLEMNRVYGAIPEFLKGIWGKIPVALGAVKSSFRAAINWIKGVYKIYLESSQYSTFS